VALQVNSPLSRTAVVKRNDKSRCVEEPGRVRSFRAVARRTIIDFTDAANVRSRRPLALADEDVVIRLARDLVTNRSTSVRPQSRYDVFLP